VKQRAALSPRLGQFGPNWVNKFFCVLSSFLSRCFLLLACVYNCSIHFVFWLLDYSLLHTSSLLLVCFLIEFTTVSVLIKILDFAVCLHPLFLSLPFYIFSFILFQFRQNYTSGYYNIILYFGLLPSFVQKKNIILYFSCKLVPHVHKY